MSEPDPCLKHSKGDYVDVIDTFFGTVEKHLIFRNVIDGMSRRKKRRFLGADI